MIVTYAHGEDAARALIEGGSVFQRELKFFPCNTADQPRDDVCPIDMLSSDALLLIFKYLQYTDLLQVARVSRKFSDICKISLRKLRFLDVSAINGINFCKLVNILRNIGRGLYSLKADLKHFPIDNSTEVILDYIQIYCPNLMSLSLSGCVLKKVPEKFYTMFADLKVLRLSGDITDDIEFCLMRCNRLVELDISNTLITGKCFYGLRDLSRLIVNGCGLFTASYFLVILKNCRELHTLEIKNCPLITRNAIADIPLCQPHLRYLAISASSISLNSPLVRLQYLTSLKIFANKMRSTGKYIDNFLATLAKHNKCLEELYIYDWPIINTTLKSLTLFPHLKIVYFNDSSKMQPSILGQLLEKQKIEELTVMNCFLLKNEDLLRYIRNCPNLKVTHPSQRFKIK